VNRFIAYISILFLLACNYTGPVESFNSVEVTHDHYCIQPIQQSVGLKYLWWPDDTITYKYLYINTKKSQETIDRYQGYYESWLSRIQDTIRSAGNEKFTFLQVYGNTFADNRFGFQESKGGLSYLGTDCRKIHQDSTSTSAGFEEYDTGDYEDGRVIPHELLHMLGFFHTQYHKDVKFNRVKYAEWRISQGWTQFQVDAFFAYKDRLAKTAVFGPLNWDSIMFYAYPAEVFENGSEAFKIANTAKLNRKVVQGDWDMIKAVYGKGTKPDINVDPDKIDCLTDFEKAEIQKLLIRVNNLIQSK